MDQYQNYSYSGYYGPQPIYIELKFVISDKQQVKKAKKSKKQRKQKKKAAREIRKQYQQQQDQRIKQEYSY